jgi:hypothetical protein
MINWLGYFAPVNQCTRKVSVSYNKLTEMVGHVYSLVDA